ncbi:MAG: hypothetical protein RSD99_27180, partial [Janthinobacterium sp.]
RTKGNGGIAPPFPSPIGTLVRNVNSLKTTSAMRRVVPRPANQVSTDNIVDISPLLEKNYTFTIAQAAPFSSQFTILLKIILDWLACVPRVISSAQRRL